MELGFVGLGKMGGFMVERLLKGGHRVVAVGHRDPAPLERVVSLGAVGVHSLEEMVAALPAPRCVWIMVPAGAAVQQTIDELIPLLAKGDTVIDGGNSNFRESIAQGKQLTEAGIHFLDAGVSGGVWGLKNGYCMMIGGDKATFDRFTPLFETLAPPDGYAYMGDTGSGHFVKMVHNGIEYGMLQAYGEGFEIMRQSQYGQNLDLYAISHLWNQSSVVRSWLLELAEDAFKRDPTLDHVRGYVDDTGEGRWTVAEALNENVPAPVITLSLLARLASRQEESFSAKVIAALRNEFGGHAMKTE